MTVSHLPILLAVLGSPPALRVTLEKELGPHTGLFTPDLDVAHLAPHTLSLNPTSTVYVRIRGRQEREGDIDS